MKKKNDYNMFTKNELASFLKQNENNFRYIDTPFDILISAKMDSVMKQIDKNLERCKELTKTYGVEKSYNVTIKIVENHTEYQKLSKEYDRLSDIRFSKGVGE